jgi:hypothetical protein
MEKSNSVSRSKLKQIERQAKAISAAKSTLLRPPAFPMHGSKSKGEREHLTCLRYFHEKILISSHDARGAAGAKEDDETDCIL